MSGGPNVLVLGAGPAGLIAAHTLLKAGCGVAVWSRGREEWLGHADAVKVVPAKSELHGCQYLHAPIFNDSGPGMPISYRLEGSAEEYREKVYGQAWRGQVSPDEYGPEADHLAWDLRATYDQLWEFWQHRITCHDIDPDYMAAFQRKADMDLIVSTLPAPSLCSRPPGLTPGNEEHLFQSQTIWAAGEVRGEPFPFSGTNGVVECNGTRDVGWYRKATMFWHTTVEWPGRRKPPIKGVVQVNKPLSTTCDCWLNDRIPVLRVGRYGKWQKGYLTHHVVADVEKALGSLQRRLF